MRRIAVLLGIGIAVAAVLWAQTSIRTAGDIEADGQLKSNVAPGTPPLAVTSTATVANLSADLLDGADSQFFAYYSEHLALQAQVNASDVTLRNQLLCRGGALRYVDLGDGTVWDCQQNLQWLKDASCLGTATFDDANGSVLDDFNDGSSAAVCIGYDPGTYQDWRLATKSEWEAAFADAVNLGCTDPCLTSDLGARLLPDYPQDGATGWVGRCGSEGPLAFAGVALDNWSSSAWTLDPTHEAWAARLNTGYVVSGLWSNLLNVWPVRGGQ